MQASRVAIAWVLALTLSAAAPGDEPTVGTDTAKTRSLVPLVRFYNTQRFFHMYTYRPDELDAWRKLKQMNEQEIVGYISTKEEPGTQRLWRAVRPDGRHYYYLEAPKQAKNVRVESDTFRAYVWKNRAGGRVPMYANSWTDGTDVFFDRDKKRTEKYAENTKKAIGVTRPDFGVVFYVYEKPPEGKPAQSSQ